MMAELTELVHLALIDWAIANISVRYRKQGQAEAALSALGDTLGQLAILASNLELPPPSVVGQDVDNEPGREADPAEQQQQE